MFADTVLLGIQKWFRGVETNLVSVRGGVGQRVVGEMSEVLAADNLLYARLRLNVLDRLLNGAALDEKWKAKVKRKIGAWQVIIESAISRGGVPPEVVEEAVCERLIDVEEGVTVLEASAH